MDAIKANIIKVADNIDEWKSYQEIEIDVNIIHGKIQLLITRYFENQYCCGIANLSITTSGIFGPTINI
jgi:hypothetical protein